MTDKKTCLVVDDSPVIREIAVRILEDLGFETSEAENAAAAVEYCSENQPDVLLLDWDLPSMGALDFLRGVRGLASEKLPVIILCAAVNDPPQFTLAKAAGAEHYILKPFDKASIEAKFSQIGLLESDAVGCPVAVNQ